MTDQLLILPDRFEPDTKARPLVEALEFQPLGKIPL